MPSGKEVATEIGKAYFFFYHHHLYENNTIFKIQVEEWDNLGTPVSLLRGDIFSHNFLFKYNSHTIKFTL